MNATLAWIIPITGGEPPIGGGAHPSHPWIPPGPHPSHPWIPPTGSGSPPVPTHPWIPPTTPPDAGTGAQGGYPGQLPASDPTGSGWVYAYVPGWGWMWCQVPPPPAGSKPVEPAEPAPEPVT